MPIPGQSPLVTINGAKEERITFQPLLLAEITWQDGFVRRMSTENLAASTGGNQYQGQDWIPRIKNQNLGALQSTTDNGVVQIPQVTLTLLDADVFLWN